MHSHHRTRVIGALIGLLVGSSGCGGGSTPTTPTPTPVLTSISLSGGTSVAVAASLSLVASPKDQNGRPIAATVTWSSGSDAIATVNNNGVVTGVTQGVVVITARSGSVSATATITVTAAPVFPANADVNATAAATFTPATVDIARNGSVNWIFASLAHTVIFDGGVSNAPADISPSTSNATVPRTFSVAGTYSYHCSIHAGMTGTVIVH